MTSLTNVFSNSLEDTTDDFISTLLFQEMRNLTKPYLNTGGDLSLLDEAKNNLITQLSFGLTLWAYMNIMKYITKVASRLALSWGYIVTGKLQKVAIDKYRKLKGKSIKGKKALNLLGSVIGTDKTLERIEVVKIVNNQINQIEKELQNHKTNKMALENKLSSYGLSASQIKGVSSQENFNLYLHKTKTSTWKNTAQDKKLFEKVTGEKITTSSTLQWSALYEQLNNYSEFAKDSEDKIFNLTEAILKIVNRTNLAR